MVQTQQAHGDPRCRGGSPMGRAGRPTVRAHFIALALAASLTACGGGDAGSEGSPSPEASASPTVFEILRDDARFSTFFRLLGEFGPEESYSLMRVETWDHTILVPVNEAFEALPEGALDQYTSSEDAFVELVDAHLVGGTVAADELAETPLAVAGLVEVTVEGDTITYAGATIIETIEARNGMVHAIDTVLFPEDVGS